MAAHLIATIGLYSAVGYLQGQSAKNLANYNARIANANADLLEIDLQNSRKRMEQQVSATRSQGNKIIGQQRTIAANSNVSVESGVVASLEADTIATVAQDINTIKNNAFLESMGIKVQQANLRNGAKMGIQSANNQANMALITGGLQGFSAGGGFGNGRPAAPVGGTESAGNGLNSSSYFSSTQDSWQPMSGKNYLGTNTRFY